MALDVRPWSEAALRALFVEKSGASLAVVEQKWHTKYFCDYFQAPDVAAQTIVVENNYTDRDYLEDFSSYYVRCFPDYDRRCTRLHFFSSAFDSALLEEALLRRDGSTPHETLQENYIGFIVVRPLPRTFVGRTCLKTYSSDHGRRRYPIIREYPVSLYGLNLKVETLGFQEQDTVAGACATSALWSIFQGTGRIFQHEILSPAKISNLADSQSAVEPRRSPSRGLDDEQAKRAIKSVGLEPHFTEVQHAHSFQSTIYGYISGRVPVYLGVALLPIARSGANLNEVNLSDLKVEAKHAVAVTGISVGADSTAQDSGFVSTASRIDQVYVHDDQIGPFSRMRLEELIVKNPGDPDMPLFVLKTDWVLDGKEAVALPEVLIIPLYHKIRIPYSFVQDAVVSFDVAIKSLLSVPNVYANFEKEKVEWDIALTTANEFAQEVLQDDQVPEACRLNLLLSPLPKFCWKARLNYDGQQQLTVLFDATDLEQGDVVVHIVEVGDLMCGAARTFAALPAVKTYQELLPHWKIWNWFNNNPKP